MSAAPPGKQLRQDALCTAPAMRKAARKLSVLRLPLRLPREASPQLLQDALCIAPATRKAAWKLSCTAPATRSQPRPGAHTRRSSARTLCVLLPRERQPGSCLHCACHAKPAAAQRRPRAPQLLQDALCLAPC